MREETNIWQQQMIVARTRTRERHWHWSCFPPTGAPGCGVGSSGYWRQGPQCTRGRRDERRERRRGERLTARLSVTWKYDTLDMNTTGEVHEREVGLLWVDLQRMALLRQHQYHHATIDRSISLPHVTVLLSRLVIIS